MALLKKLLSLVAGALVLGVTASHADNLETFCKSKVDVAIVLAVDISSSIGSKDWNLQKQGYAGAFRDENVIAAVRSGTCKRVAVTMTQWGGVSEQQVVVPWRILSTPESVLAFAEEIDELGRLRSQNTNLAGALYHATKLLQPEMLYADGLAFTPIQRIIDISGNGKNDDRGFLKASTGYVEIKLADARGWAVKEGITINGLPILSSVESGMDNYYESRVISPDGFIEVAEGIENFAQAIRKKLMREFIALR